MIKVFKKLQFKLYDFSNNIGEKDNIADNHPEILAKMESYAKQAHAENITGEWIDKEKEFKGPEFK